MKHGMARVRAGWRISRLMGRFRALYRRLTRGAELDAEMHEEMRFHIEMEADRLVRDEGLEPPEARRRALVAFGGMEKYKAEGRDTRGLPWLDALSLDVRLGLRMLIKHRALTFIGSFALAVAIAVGATGFVLITQAMSGVLPIDEGHRVVAVQYATDNPGNPERRIVREFYQWRDQLVSVQHLSAMRTIERNLAAPGRDPELIDLAEISAAAFAIARTPPLLGRYLLPEDEHRSAPGTLVIGYEVWQSRFGGDPAVIGRSVTVDAQPFVIVGVMPETFRFPINHQYWISFQHDPGRWAPLEGPEIHVFGRLAPGVSLDEAQAELTTIGQRATAANPALYARMQPMVLPYTRAHGELDDPLVAWLMWIVQLLLSGLVAVVGVNVATLMYAHTMARRAEMAMRTALGASRRRILGQLFLEAFALSLIGAALGLLLTQAALQEFRAVLVASGAAFIPYWFSFHISASTVLYSVGLATAAALIVGVVPGVRVTGEGLQASLRELGTGTSVRLGRRWSFLIVSQVAVAVAVLPLAMVMVWKVAQIETGAAGFPVEQYLVGEIALSEDAGVRVRQQEMMSRLENEPGVTAVTFSSAVPGSASAVRRMEFDLATPFGATGALAGDALLRPTGIVQVDPRLFEVYGGRFLAGRSFHSGEADGASSAVIVDRTFVQLVMGARPVLGQRFRYTRPLLESGEGESASAWYEIVGVVDDIPASPLEPSTEKQPTVFHPTLPGDVHPVVLSVLLTGRAPADFVERFRTIGAEVDPTMRLRNVEPLTDAYDRTRSYGRFLAWGLSLVTVSVLLLSAAGIYALMSFTLAQRTREIGIRTALGAPPLRIVAGIFGQVTRQLALGVTSGFLISSVLLSSIMMTRTEMLVLLLIVPGTIALVGFVAAFGPTRRSLRIQTTAALRA